MENNEGRSIEIVESAGFCFGVKRAVEGVTELAKNGKGKYYTVGELIHNRTVLDELASMGITAIKEDGIGRIASEATEDCPVTAVIRAHGITAETEEKLIRKQEENPFFKVVDFTCPFVKKIHKIAAGNRDKRFVIYGDPNHPEVMGILSRAGSDAFAVSSPEDAEKLGGDEKPTVLTAQTTANTEKWKKVQKIIKKDFTNPLIFDTICSVTENRQAETAALASRCDLMIVIGSRQSSNTTKLFEISEANCSRVIFTETPEHLSIKDKTFRKVGITAGASTPPRLIQEVYKLMSEIITNEDFSAMLDEACKSLNTGDIVKGTVVSVSGTELHVDLDGTKFTGIISAEEAGLDANTKLTDAFKLGDEIEAAVVKVSDRDGIADLSKKRVDAKNKWKAFIAAYESGEVLEGKVVKATKKRDTDTVNGLIIKYEDKEIFVPASQSGVAKDGDVSAVVGQTKKFKVIEIDEAKKRAVASISKVEYEERKARKAEREEAKRERDAKELEILQSLTEGQYFYGAEVKSLTSYGAFVDIGGIDGMVHSSELSWSRIKSPADVVSVGDKIDVFVKNIDIERRRISLGYKTEETKPWFVFKSNYNVGDVIDVKIVSIMPFGAFAEITDDIDGLIHISQCADHKIASPADVLAVGQEVKVVITDINDEKQQVGLSIRALLAGEAVEEPAEEEAAVYSSDDENVDVQ